MHTGLIKGLKDFLSLKGDQIPRVQQQCPYTRQFGLFPHLQAAELTAAELAGVDGKGQTDRQVADLTASKAKPQALTLLLLSLLSSEGLRQPEQPGSAPPPPSPAKARQGPHSPPGYLFGPFMGKIIL